VSLCFDLFALKGENKITNNTYGHTRRCARGIINRANKKIVLTSTRRCSKIKFVLMLSRSMHAAPAIQIGGRRDLSPQSGVLRSRSCCRSATYIPSPRLRLSRPLDWARLPCAVCGVARRRGMAAVWRALRASYDGAGARSDALKASGIAFSGSPIGL